MVAQPFFRRPASSVAFQIFALEDNIANTDWAEAVAELNGRTVRLLFYTGQALDIYLVHWRFVGVTIG